ncbi:3-carboxy-cis,cis-muconate cycloisomerase [Rhizobium sp. WL3]|uniref:3-carboxy-cis,cis-muconate cycloisomerase n=1 Tax=Rhizobium sp. WL3 TaxID=2603277 RepID=UPI0011C1FB08|nr:3-carboxy-cis,cis-muconate cycloisomerase [Rhizobium sp. WL3]QEE45047.1 3-carboxy-cis,cis-muconate cycloisomerase [Rhizobium sp. WL3]
MTASVFDHPILSGLLGDDEIGAQFSGAAELSAMLRFEVALAEAEAAEGVIPGESAEAIAALPEAFVADLDALKQAIGRDGVVIPDLVRQWRAGLDDAGKHLHFGATSQDAIDTGQMMRLGAVLSTLDQRMAAIISFLDGLETRFGTQSLMGRTRMQAAIPITVADRLATWKRPVVAHRAAVQGMLKTGLPLQFGGAVGTLEKLGDKASLVRTRLACLLQLSDRPQWHSQRAVIAEIGGLFSQITGSLGKIGQDLTLMADNGTAVIGGGGASSAMPHKRNPVKAEVLVTLARFNAVQISGLHQALVHEQERSGAAWTLEWMILPQMAIATGAATRLATEVLQSIEQLGDR